MTLLAITPLKFLTDAARILAGAAKTFQIYFFKIEFLRESRHRRRSNASLRAMLLLDRQPKPYQRRERTARARPQENHESQATFKYGA